VRRFIFAIVLTAIAAAPALAEVRIMSSAGGPVVGYLEFFSKVRKLGERVVIEGPCLSACTVVLSTIPRNRICVTSRAVLGFHAPIVADQYREITRAINATYPPAVRAWIKHNGGLTQNVILLRGQELAALYPHCS
jgi:hypothetical protein